MYERPETAPAIERLWSALNQALHDIGLNAEAELLPGAHGIDHWRDPDLLISQTCGMPYRLHLHGHVHLVGSPVSTLSDPPGYYHSVIIAHKDDPRTQFKEFRAGKLACNDQMSQSGWAAPQTMAKEHDFIFEDITFTGGHHASARMVAERGACIAAIDAVTWALICKFDAFSDQLKVIGHTSPTPALPFITARPELVGPLFKALACAIDALPLVDQSCLCLKGITKIAAEDYLAVPTPARP